MLTIRSVAKKLREKVLKRQRQSLKYVFEIMAPGSDAWNRISGAWKI